MEEYKMVTISLEIEEEASLNILLASDGTINRKGDGTYKIDGNFFMGITDTGIFQCLKKYITDDFKSSLGKVYDLPGKEGKSCTLEIVLAGDKEGNGMKFIYGADSMGPPGPVADFVEAAIQLTDAWFYEQQSKVKQPERPKRKWWEFWKG
jgi:hypothetical protein